MIDIRDYLKIAIAKSGLKQSAIALKVNLTAQQLSDIVNKRRKLEVNEFFNICQVINVTPNELLEIKIEESPKQRTA